MVKNGSKNVRPDLRRHAAPGVGHRQHHLPPGTDVSAVPQTRIVPFDVMGFDDQLAAVRHGVARIDRQVEDHLLDLTRIDLDRIELRIEDGREPHILSNQPFQHPFGGRHLAVEVDHPGRQNLLAAERQKLRVKVAARRPAFAISAMCSRSGSRSCRFSMTASL